MGSGVKDDGIVIDPGVGAWPPLSIDQSSLVVSH